MFSGIGGFEYGIEKAIGSEAECIGYSEVDKYAIQTYEKHFQHKNYGDATKINPSELPDFDMLCGGFPCQAFSIAGKRRGFQDTRGTLFFEIARIIKAKRPKIVWLENVKGLLNHDKGKTFRTIIQTLSELGYDVQWMVLNSKFFGVPQNRERVFIIGSLRGEPRPEILPLGKSSKGDDEKNCSATITSSYRKGCNNHNQLVGETKMKWYGRDVKTGKDGKNPLQEAHRVYSPEGIMQTVKPTPLMIDVYNKKMHSDRTPALTEPHHNSLRLMQNTKIRRLTPTECERLQGFPDGWTKGFSDTQRYKMMGNAVTVNVIKAIGEKLLTSFQANKNKNPIKDKQPTKQVKGATQ